MYEQIEFIGWAEVDQQIAEYFERLEEKEEQLFDFSSNHSAAGSRGFSPKVDRLAVGSK